MALDAWHTTSREEALLDYIAERVWKSGATVSHSFRVNLFNLDHHRLRTDRPTTTTTRGRGTYVHVFVYVIVFVYLCVYACRIVRTEGAWFSSGKTGMEADFVIHIVVSSSSPAADNNHSGKLKLMDCSKMGKQSLLFESTWWLCIMNGGFNWC